MEDIKLECIDWTTIDGADNYEHIKKCCRTQHLPAGRNIAELKILLFHHSIRRVLSILAIIPNSERLTSGDKVMLATRCTDYIAAGRASIVELQKAYNAEREKVLATQDTQIQLSLDGIQQGRGIKAVVLDVPTREPKSWQFKKLEKKAEVIKKAPAKARKTVGLKTVKIQLVTFKEEDLEEEDLGEGGVEPFAGIEEKDFAFKAPTVSIEFGPVSLRPSILIILQAKKRKLSPGTDAIVQVSEAPPTPRRSGRNQK